MEETTRNRTRTDAKAKEVKVQLDFPIKVGGTELGTLTIRRPKVRDLLTMDAQGGTDSEKEMRMLCNLAQIAPEEAKEIDLGDYAKISKIILGFTGARPEISAE